MRLLQLSGELAIVRLPAGAAVPSWLPDRPFVSLTRTEDELSIICLSTLVPPEERAETGWIAFRVADALDFSMTGVVSSLASPLAGAGISIFVVSTFDTDYILVRLPAADAARAAWRAAGHEVT
ncbi:MAG TPA: ACT domain-containing protein [Thermoanaerobaculia bacterium]|nr:ACT domain-containing protein [Thermoanaerobaculia bacterium]